MKFKSVLTTFAAVLPLAVIPPASGYNFWDQGLVAGTVNTAFTDALMGSAGAPNHL